jgi:hypothetical protein
MRGLENEMKPPPPLPSLFTASFVQDADGCPMMPSICEDTTTPDDLRSMLTAFIKEQWSMSSFHYIYSNFANDTF